VLQLFEQANHEPLHCLGHLVDITEQHASTCRSVKKFGAGLSERSRRDRKVAGALLHERTVRAITGQVNTTGDEIHAP
jgi:hypothetical protein